MQVFDAQGRPKRYQTPKALADGQLANAKAAIYTSPSGVRTRANKLTLFNTNATTQVINLYINTSGTSRQFRRIELEQYESADVLVDEREIVLEAGDSIEADTTTATAVDYTVSGETEK